MLQANDDVQIGGHGPKVQSKLGKCPFMKKLDPVGQTDENNPHIPWEKCDNTKQRRSKSCKMMCKTKKQQSLLNNKCKVQEKVCCIKNRIGVSTFCRAFPFHLIFNKELELLQVGVAFLRVLSADRAASVVYGKKSKLPRTLFNDQFTIVSPTLQTNEINFETLLQFVNEPFTIQLKKLENPSLQHSNTPLMSCRCSSESKDNISTQIISGMDIRGQMVYVEESKAMLFLGSPNLRKLEELNKTGMFISDIPIHDATRDVILVGEQTTAQESLKRRMDKIRGTLEENNNALEQERRLNVDLLYSIFPVDIAEDLWLGKQVKARQLQNVTMLFSDIVGFTSICATCTPMEVISMLSNLYVLFDKQCGIYDVYKVETIGDAYCVAGGLHRATDTHAHQIAWMALFMMNCAGTVYTPTGLNISMRIGVHTGSVVTGVVGTRMPRYCLFGNNVTLANKFESHSEAGRIYVSPTSYKFLCKDPGFKFTPRARDKLPAGFPPEIPGCGYFLDEYTLPMDEKLINQLHSDISSRKDNGLLETNL
ncbi:guanylate cyclase soluble subunit alpha-2 isoform X1 [Ciona intestinalis]